MKIVIQLNKDRSVILMRENWGMEVFGLGYPNKKYKKKVAAPSTLTFLLLERLVL
jgi:hypothetical protein